MSRTCAVVLAAGSLWCCGVGAFAEPPKPAATAPSADATAILKSARDAASQVQAISYSGRVFGIGALEGKVPTTTATISAARADAGGWRLAVKGGVNEGDTFEVGYDGVTARSIREKDKIVVQKTITDMSDLSVFLSSQLCRHQVAWELFADSPLAGNDADARLAGSGMADGQDCSIVFIPAPAKAEPDMEGGIRVYIAKSDHLPRRIERLAVLPNDKTAPSDNKSGRVLEITDVAVNDASVAGNYNLDVPTGFRVKVADAAPKAKVKAPSEPNPPVDNGLLDVGSLAPDWSLKDPSGTQYKLSDLKGKVVVMDFWATWCGPCKAAMPSVQKLHERFKGKPVLVFGMNCWERGDAPAYMKSKKFTYTTLLKADDAANAYKVTGIPTFYIVGTDGKIIHASVGFDPANEEALAAKIEAALK